MARRRDEIKGMNQISQVAKTLGYLTYHVHDSRRSEPGFPDLWILGFGILIVLETKAGNNTVTVEQQRWLEELRNASVDAREYNVDRWKQGDRSIVDELMAAKREYRRRNHAQQH